MLNWVLQSKHYLLLQRGLTAGMGASCLSPSGAEWLHCKGTLHL